MRPWLSVRTIRFIHTYLLLLLTIVALSAAATSAQQSTGAIKGQVIDEFGGAIVGASVTVIDAKGSEKTATTNGEGNYVISSLAPGKYTIRATANGFATFENTEVEITAGRSEQINVTLKVTIEQQKVTVTPEGTGVNTDPENNVGAIVLRGSDLESLPEDPDDLAAALQALAGPAAGPNGGQIYIDGFSGGRLPPLSSIREIRINSNPFSAEYDRAGMGRIEIFTRPGTDRFRGQVSFNFNNDKLNTRNPFAPTRAPYMSRQYGGNLSGPISKKKASFFVDFEKRDVDNQAVINATILDPNFNIVPFADTVPIPDRRTTISPRIDYQLNSKITLVGRYEYEHSKGLTGVGGFSLGSRLYSTSRTQQTVRLTETAMLNKTTVNETRFQFNRNTSGDTANNTIPTIQVQDAFTGGGSQIGLSSSRQNSWEATNITSLVHGTHTIRFGGRLRDAINNSFSPQNFGGTWTFSGRRNVANPDGVTSIQVYQITEQGLAAGLSPVAIRAAGGGATQFTITRGKPEASASQWDFGGFAQDDWRYRPNLTLSFGLRYENQGNISSNLNFAPRVGFAWQPPVRGGHQPKTTVRGGFGIFYDRVPENLTLNAKRFNGTNQQQYLVTDPAILNLYPTVPSIDVLQKFATPVNIYQLAPDVRAAYMMQSIVSLERSLPHNTAISVTYSRARTLHMLRARALNAPLPGTFVPAVPGSGVRPLGVNNYYEYDATGRYNQNQLIVQMNSRFSRNLTFMMNYAFAKAMSDTDGAGTFSSNPFDFSQEYGRASGDVRHRFVLQGTYRTFWGVSMSPFLILTSGTPFNITIGRDLNGDNLFSDRPALATDTSKPGVVVTKFGTFDTNPTSGALIIPRNYGQGPGAITANLRVSKSFGFGGERQTTSQNQNNRDNQNRGAGRPGGVGMGGARGGGAGGGGPRGGGGGGGRGGGGGGGFGGFGAGDAPKKYNLTVSVNFQNVFNHVNLGRPVGNLSSLLFGTSTTSAGGFGGFGGRGGGGSAPFNRLIEAQVRFSF